MNKYFREQKERLVVGKTYNLDFPPHIHEELELVYMAKGSCTAFCADREYKLFAGDFFLAFPEQVHYYYNSCNCLAYLVIVHPGQLAIERRTPVNAVYACSEDDLVSLLELTCREHEQNKAHSVTVSMLQALLGKLLRHYQFQNDLQQNSVAEQLVRYCSNHYKQPLSISSVAKALYLSQSHISHTFNDKLKISFSDYVNSLRLDEAVRLLSKDGISIEQIAELSGFPTTRTFHRVFRKKYGMSPREYKKSGL